MKTIILIALAFSAQVFAGVNPAGKYKNVHEIMAAMYSTKKDCVDDGGKWIKADGVCVMKTSDNAEVTRIGNDFNILITTVATNMHTCEFEGAAVLKGNTLVSEVASEEYNYETSQIESTTCVVEAVLSNAGKNMSIKTNGKCRSFCGANGWLEVNLKKVK
jgi:hypothetical protein